MPAKIPLVAPPQLSSGFHPTQNTPEAAVLGSLGVEVLSSRRDYMAKNGGSRGVTEFALDAKSGKWEMFDSTNGSGSPYSAKALSDAYHGRLSDEPGAFLDDLIEQVEPVELRNQIKNTLPLMVASYGRAIFQHYQQLLQVVKSSPKIIRGKDRRGRDYAVDSRNREFAKRHDL